MPNPPAAAASLGASRFRGVRAVPSVIGFSLVEFCGGWSAFNRFLQGSVVFHSLVSWGGGGCISPTQKREKLLQGSERSQECVFCMQASDGEGCPAASHNNGASNLNDVSAGLGLDKEFCGGGDPEDCSTSGKWAGRRSTLVWGRLKEVPEAEEKSSTLSMSCGLVGLVGCIQFLQFLH